MTKPGLLIVDDDLISIRMLHKIFENDYVVSFAQDEKTALKLVADNKPDVLLLDVELEETTGYELLIEMQQKHMVEDSKVFIVTAHSDGQLDLSSISSQVKAILYKPVNIGMLETVNHFVKQA